MFLRHSRSAVDITITSPWAHQHQSISISHIFSRAIRFGMTTNDVVCDCVRVVNALVSIKPTPTSQHQGTPTPTRCLYWTPTPTPTMTLKLKLIRDSDTRLVTAGLSLSQPRDRDVIRLSSTSSSFGLAGAGSQ